jgi:type I restriction enzyme M protein
MKGLSIKVPSKEIQTRLIEEVEKREKKIKDLKETIAGIDIRKEALIKSYLVGTAGEPQLAMAAEPKREYKKKKGKN